MHPLLLPYPSCCSLRIIGAGVHAPSPKCSYRSHLSSAQRSPATPLEPPRYDWSNPDPKCKNRSLEAPTRLCNRHCFSSLVVNGQFTGRVPLGRGFAQRGAIGGIYTNPNSSEAWGSSQGVSKSRIFRAGATSNGLRQLTRRLISMTAPSSSHLLCPIHGRKVPAQVPAQLRGMPRKTQSADGSDQQLARRFYDWTSRYPALPMTLKP
ncbi:hypothetical protein B0T16DRAFT_146261 [Cercophora newfieldiana]|uniref:Uncharacterized protein n=1 Tax=Cercophora newfieldiana TaxID=92897 RepID=A0AA40CQQ8_9PEZI|nr:hypothetical protein B0T16DRAFT_146261 [Cercophora newfieldiana]